LPKDKKEEQFFCSPTQAAAGEVEEEFNIFISKNSYSSILLYI
jgi:hypothetical protein